MFLFALMRSVAYSYAVVSILVIQSALCGQGADPFSTDPFSARQKQAVRGKPVSIRARVTDEAGQPIRGALVSAFGLGRGVQSDHRGEAVLRTGVGNLEAVAKRTSGRIGVSAIPFRSGVNRVAARERFSVEDLLQGNVLELRMMPAVMIRGRVVCRQDGKPVESVHLKVVATSPEGEERSWSISTNERGEYTLVIERVETQIQVAAVRPHVGFDFRKDVSARSQDEPRYYEEVLVSKDARSIDVPDIQLVRIPPYKVTVVDAAGAPVANARLQAMWRQWLKVDFPMWNYLSDPISTDDSGCCDLVLSEQEWQDGVVDASAVIDGVKVFGRASIPPRESKDAKNPNQKLSPIRVVVQRPGIISGTLKRQNRSDKEVQLVLYEAVQTGTGQWKSCGLRGAASTDSQGRYQFAATVGIPYVIAVRDRNPDGTQTILHWIRKPLTVEGHEVPSAN